MTEHILKTWSDYWDAIERGEKPFEVRRDDRGFQKGDVLVLRRMVKDFMGAWITDYWLDDKGIRRPKEIRQEITYVLTGGQLGVDPGYVVMGLKKA